MKLAFRPATSDADLKFCVESMLENQLTSYSAGLVPVDRWFDTMRPFYTALITQPGMRAVVAYEKDDPDFFYGWIAADPTDQRIKSRDHSVKWWPALVLYVMVKQNFRKRGVARALFAAVGVDPGKPFLYVANTQQASRLASKVPMARFNPLAIRFPKDMYE